MCFKVGCRVMKSSKTMKELINYFLNFVATKFQEVSPYGAMRLEDVGKKGHLEKDSRRWKK